MSAARFYFGQVTHNRSDSVKHKLRYRLAYLFVDLDNVAEAGRASRLLGMGGKGLLSFNPLDHGDGKSTDLAHWVRTKLSEHNCPDNATKIRLLTLPRMFGYVFNPLSVYFIYNENNQLRHILYEVANTFGERHFYLCPVEKTSNQVHHICDKAFYVSPFFDVSGTYTFNIVPPSDHMSVHIRYDDPSGHKLMTASLSGKATAVTTASCLKILMSFPFMTLGVVAGIHWQAVKLWFKGAKYHPHKPSKTPPLTTVSKSSRLNPERNVL